MLVEEEEARPEVADEPQARKLPFSDPEFAAAAGRAGAETRRRQAAMTPEERAFDAIGRNLGQLTRELIDAALGSGDFEDLKLETRVTALTRLMEWRLGRPTTAKSPPEDPETPVVPDDGNALFE